jgi:acyl-CoA hydrolase
MEGKAKPVALSKVETQRLIQPSDLNIFDTLFGGKLVSWVDEIAAIAAHRHSALRVVTLSIDELMFEAPVTKGDIITIKASVNRVFKSSMEVGVKVTQHHLDSDIEKRICRAFLTFVVIDENHEPCICPPCLPESTDELRRYENALIRRESRMRLRESLS